ncbi:hypothetical protein AB6813_21380 [bacterium RCC_150]
MSPTQTGGPDRWRIAASGSEKQPDGAVLTRTSRLALVAGWTPTDLFESDLS